MQKLSQNRFVNIEKNRTFQAFGRVIRWDFQIILRPTLIRNSQKLVLLVTGQWLSLKRNRPQQDIWAQNQHCLLCWEAADQGVLQLCLGQLTLTNDKQERHKIAQNLLELHSQTQRLSLEVLIRQTQTNNLRDQEILCEHYEQIRRFQAYWVQIKFVLIDWRMLWEKQKNFQLNIQHFWRGFLRVGKALLECES